MLKLFMSINFLNRTTWQVSGNLPQIHIVFITNLQFLLTSDLLTFLQNNQYTTCFTTCLRVKQLKIDLSTEYLVILILAHIHLT